MTRINKVLELMAKLTVDSVIIKDVTTIRYLTGFTGDSSLFYLDRQQGVLITDGRYTQQAKAEMKLFKVLEYKPTNANSIWVPPCSEGGIPVGFGVLLALESIGVLEVCRPCRLPWENFRLHCRSAGFRKGNLRQRQRSASFGGGIPACSKVLSVAASGFPLVLPLRHLWGTNFRPL